MPLQPGDRIERYVIDALLGAGGMGEVYRAHDARLQRAVALKIVRIDKVGGASSPSSTQSAERMLREARTAAALDHPNVVAIFDVGQVESPEELRGTTYIAMELIKGSSLRTLIGDAGVPIDRRVAWLADVARALAAAHAAGLIHRDVKPENVMIRDDGLVKVLDFGIAKRTTTIDADPSATTQASSGTLTADGVVVGTPMYMAPEQMRGDAIDGRVDQFAWGVVAYELLTGKLPWSASAQGGALALVAQILSAEPAPFPESAEIPPRVAETVMRALAKARTARFPTMDALVEALTGVSPLAQTGRVGSVVPPPPRVSSGGTGPAEIAPAGPAPVAAASSGGDGAGRGRGGAARWWTIGALGIGALASAAGVVAVRQRSRAVVIPADAATGCTSQRACVESHGGEPYVCRASDGTCVPIASPDCTAMYEPKDLLADDTVWLGAMFPLKGPMADGFGRMNMEGADFARKEIAQATSTFEGANGSQRVRRIALVGCDDSEDPMRAAKHLADDVGVPAIVGLHSGKEIMEVAGSFLIPRKVLTVASLTTTPQITRLPQPADLPRMVWRTTYSMDQVAEVTAKMIESALEPRQTGGRTRVTLLRPDGKIGAVSFAEALYRALRFNGKAAKDNGRDYQEITYDGDDPEKNDIPNLGARIAAGAPTFVIALGATALGKGFVGTVIEQVELRSKMVKPTYVIEMETFASYKGFLEQGTDRRRRLYTITSVSNSMPNARFVIRYNEAHVAPVSRTFNPGPTYDAIHLLADAAFALGSGPVTGPGLGRAFAKLVPPGRPIEVGPASALDVISALSTDAHVDLQGTQSALDFDLSTGEGPADFALVCAEVDSSGHPTGENVESGVVFHAATGKVDGSINCP